MLTTCIVLIAIYALAVLASVLAERRISRRLIGWDSAIFTQCFGTIVFTFVLYAELTTIRPLGLLPYGSAAFWLWIGGCVSYAAIGALYVLFSRLHRTCY